MAGQTMRSVVLIAMVLLPLAAAQNDGVDWRAKGVVGPVTDQGQCGSSAVFAATGALESLLAIGTGKPFMALSRQQLIDCVPPAGSACSGGFQPVDAFRYVAKHGLCSAADYKPVKSGECQANTCGSKVPPGFLKTPDGSMNVTSDDDAALAAAVDVSPVVVTVNAQPWEMYSGGVFSGKCADTLDHDVLVVGYTADYWIAQNSWGSSWGEKGYIRLARTVGATDHGECGILDMPIVPVQSH